MHNLKTNFDKFYELVKESLAEELNAAGNLQFYPRLPKMNDCSIIALSLLEESLGIDSENYLFGKLKSDYAAHFPHLIDRSNYNRRRRRLRFYIHRVATRLSNLLNEGEDVFLLDSIPLPLCKNIRYKRSRFRFPRPEQAPDKGYSAVGRSYYYGYKLHLAVSLKGVFCAMELTRASVHDLHYLKELTAAVSLRNALLIGDKAYASTALHQLLYQRYAIRVETPPKARPHQQAAWQAVFGRARKRIETIFSQFCDQLMLKRNYAKCLTGLCTRIISKVATLTALQFFNHQQAKPLNHLKYALAF